MEMGRSMATISTSEEHETIRIFFRARDGSRQAIYLGKVRRALAERVRSRVEELENAAMGLDVVSRETLRWLRDVPDLIHGKLEKFGLADARRRATLKELLDACFKHLEVKPITSLGYEATRKAMLSFFGERCLVGRIRPLDCEEWRTSLKAAGLAEATISKRIKLGRQFFKKGITWKMLMENPFAGVKAGSQMNRARQRFISLADSLKVLDACPDVEWQVIFALARFGGLRCPSEVLSLRWSDVDWSGEQFRVKCSKTERHSGHEERWTPIFCELKPYLLKAFHAAEEGAEFVVTRYRDGGVNLRTQFKRIIVKAGLLPWPKLF